MVKPKKNITNIQVGGNPATFSLDEVAGLVLDREIVDIDNIHLSAPTHQQTRSMRLIRQNCWLEYPSTALDRALHKIVSSLFLNEGMGVHKVQKNGDSPIEYIPITGSALEVLQNKGIITTVPSILNLRTNENIYPIGSLLVIDDYKGLTLPISRLRRQNTKAALAEMMFYLSGLRDATELKKHTKIWNNFMEDGTNIIKNSYGYRWRNYYGRDQITDLIAQLQKNPSCRQCTVMQWSPAHDGLGNTDNEKNVPCPLGFSTSVRNIGIGGEKKSFDMTVFQRAVDVLVGLPYDILGFKLLHIALAQILGFEIGDFNYVSHNPHIYQKHIKTAIEMNKLTPSPSSHNKEPQIKQETAMMITKAFEDIIFRKDIIPNIFNGIDEICNAINDDVGNTSVIKKKLKAY